MTKEELEAILIERGIPSYAYSLKGGLPNDSMVLNQKGLNCWEVYYSERGGKSILETFKTESEACQCLLYRMS